MEEKDVQRLLDMLYGMIDEAKSAAFSSEKCIINRDEALDLLDEVRAKLPLEIKKAQELVRAREEYVSAAKKEVEKMLRQAELDAKVIVSESETLQQARQRSSEIIRRAESRSKELYRGEGVPCALPRRLTGADAGAEGADQPEALRPRAERGGDGRFDRVTEF